MGASSSWFKGTLLPSLFRQTGTEVAHRGFSAPVVVRPRDETAATVKYEYHHPDEGDDPQEDRFLAKDLSLARRIKETIDQHYPGHPWHVWIEAEQGIVQIRLAVLMDKLSFNCHVAAIEHDPQMKQIVDGCGELLERFGFSRQSFSRDDFTAAVLAKPIGLREEVPGGSYSRRW